MHKSKYIKNLNRLTEIKQANDENSVNSQTIKMTYKQKE